MPNLVKFFIGLLLIVLIPLILILIILVVLPLSILRALTGFPSKNFSFNTIGRFFNMKKEATQSSYEHERPPSEEIIDATVTTVETKEIN